jgi:hypothetical protein
MDNEIDIDREVQEFQIAFSPFGYLDIKRAIEFFNKFDLTYNDLIEAIENYQNSTGIEDYSNIDICYIAYDYILQEASRIINEITEFDILEETGLYIA